MATTITTRLNALSSTLHGKTTTSPIASYVPMDGYHLTRAQLSAMLDPEHAHARRGAAFTFDPASLHTLVKKLKEPLAPRTPTYFAPSFDHALKDPVANDISIPPTSRIVVFEGNYLSLGKGEWKEITELMDELWFVDVDFEIAGRRLASRHVRAGLAPNEEEAWKRVRENDLVNGKEIVEFRVKVNKVVVSKEDDNWKPTL